jgi:hypothetical protein
LTVGEFVATHAVPEGGTRAWREPDPALAAEATLAAHLPVQVLESRPNGWAHVVCANGWSTWVDGRALVEGRAVAARKPYAAALTAPITPGALAYGGAAAAVLGSFLPWLTAGDLSVNGWDVGFAALVKGHGSADGVKAGMIVLLVALVALPLVTKKPLPVVAVAALGGLATNPALLTYSRNHASSVPAGTGAGLVLTIIGGVAVLASAYVGFVRTYVTAATR